MTIDTSALVAILTDEPERETFLRALAAAGEKRMSAATYAETGIVLLNRHGPGGYHLFEHFVARAGIDVEPVDVESARRVIEAYRRYGRGRHPAGLNVGDCFTYACAAARRGGPLLYKGDDFGLTDLTE
jgi:ribonuclease VapC